MRASALHHALLAMAGLGLAAAVPTVAQANADIIIVNVDGPNEGFNDPTPRAPIGGNPGTTVGQQRLIAFQRAADIWGETLDSPVPIRIRAAFNPLTCTSTSATLGSAGAIYVWKNFTAAPLPETWYHEALANKYAREDLQAPGDATDPYDGADLNAQFNSSIGTVAGCLTGSDWYYGLDANHGSNIDLIAVLLHEFGHGLGFSSFVSRPSGAYIFGQPGVYDLFIRDNTTSKDWFDMTNAERATSMKNGRNVVWTGATVTAQAPGVLSYGMPLLNITAPSGIAGSYPVGTAAFGPALSSPGVSGTLALAVDAADAAGPSTTDGCSAITSNVAGKIAVLDRGTCGFVVKVKNAQDAGAIAVVVADNAAGSPPAGLGGADPSITIPSVRVTLAAGNTIKANLGAGVSGTLGVDMTVLAGADSSNRVMLNTPDPVVSGSSVSHWDPVTFRNQLMEPAINGDLTHSVKSPEDLTLAQMRDIGWFPDADVDNLPDGTDACPNSTIGGTVEIQGCATDVDNTFFANGCTIQDKLDACAATTTTHEEYTACTTQYTNDLKRQGVINNKQKAVIQACAAKSSFP